MMKAKAVSMIIFVTAILGVVGCASMGGRAPSCMSQYDIHIQGKPDATFENSNIKAAFAITALKEGVSFDLFNKGSQAVTVDWNSASFIDTAGVSHPVIHQGVRFVNKAAPQAVTVIPPGTRLQDQVIPSDNIFVLGSGWATRSFIPKAPSTGNPRMDATLGYGDSAAFVGKTFAVRLPMTADGKPIGETLTFEITGASCEAQK